MVDNFNRFVHIAALENRKSGTLAKFLMDRIVGVFGPPKIMKSDNGSEFSGLFREVCRALGIKHQKTLPYHPQSNGIAERFVRTVKDYLLRYLVGRELNDWEEVLP